jgi:hypothetical protein
VSAASNVLPGQLLTAAERPVQDFVEELRSAPPIPTRSLPASVLVDRVPSSLLTASHVYVRRGGALPPLSPPYAGPYVVTGCSDKYFHVQVGDRVETISVDRLKPHLGQEAVAPPPAAKRGRPPRMPLHPGTASPSSTSLGRCGSGGPCSGKKSVQ